MTKNELDAGASNTEPNMNDDDIDPWLLAPDPTDELGYELNDELLYPEAFWNDSLPDAQMEEEAVEEPKWRFREWL